MTLSLTPSTQMYQLFQPMCGVNARVSPQTIFSGRRASPSALRARNVTTYWPRFSIAPVIWPVCRSTFNPSGRSSTANSMGRRPVAGIVNKKGWPGRTPKTRAPLIRGAAGAFGVRITASSRGAERASDPSPSKQNIILPASMRPTRRLPRTDTAFCMRQLPDRSGDKRREGVNDN